MKVQGSICNGNLGSTFLMNKKQEVREKALLVRKQLLSEDINRSAKDIKKVWNSVKKEFNLQNIGFYWPTAGEASPLLIIEELIAQNAHCFLPVVSKNLSSRKLIFKEFTSESKVKKNRFNILEPSRGRTFDIKNLDLIFIPCTCFDEQGFRTGMGMGFYDETLKGLPLSTKLVILGHDFQKIESCHPEEHDVPADMAVTPSECLRFYSRKAE